MQPISTARPDDAPWWRDAVVYQVYIRSFADGNGDGIGDIAGLRSRLPYLQRLGIDAIWITPWYLSPQSDHGYDVTSYFVIDPLFGTVAEAEAMFGEAHALGIRVIVDIVPKHSSDRHPWFEAALGAAPGGSERALYYFRPGRGADGSAPPNNWMSSFGGPAWTRTAAEDGTPGEWFLHIHAAEQPDLNWADPRVRQSFEEVLRFWFDRGVDGFRVDVARGLFKDPALPDLPDGPIPDGEHPYQDREEVHGVYRRWREIADEYDGARMFVAEVWSEPHRLARYLRSDELQTAFNFDFLLCPWEAGALRRVIDRTLKAVGAVGAPATWVLSNHDFVRHPNRYGRPRQPWSPEMGWMGKGPLDLPAGLRRARAAALAVPFAARRRLHLPGRGARAAGGRGPARRSAPGPGLFPIQWRPAGPGRVPCAPALDRPSATLRLRPGRLHALAAATGGLGVPDRGRPGGGPVLDLVAVPPGTRPAPVPPRAGQRQHALARLRGRGPGLHAAARIHLRRQPFELPGASAARLPGAAVQRCDRRWIAAS